MEMLANKDNSDDSDSLMLTVKEAGCKVEQLGDDVLEKKFKKLKPSSTRPVTGPTT